MEYTRLTNLEVTGHLKVAGQEVTPGGGGGGGGSGLVVLQGTVGQDEESIVLTNTYAELYTMLQNGPVFVKCPNYDGLDVYYDIAASISLNEGVYHVICKQMEGSGSASDTVVLSFPY